MKKIAVFLGVFVVFVLYSAGIRHELPVISKPASLIKKPAVSRTNTNDIPANNSPSDNNSTSPVATGTYKDGTYTGSTADAYYGNVQVAVTVLTGKITDVKFLQYPDSHPTSVDINQQAMPYLQQEAIKSQGPNVNVISGATFTSQAFIQSLSSALSQA